MHFVVDWHALGACSVYSYGEPSTYDRICTQLLFYSFPDPSPLEACFGGTGGCHVAGPDHRCHRSCDVTIRLEGELSGEVLIVARAPDADGSRPNGLEQLATPCLDV